jgi:crossover junction endodeoxyribonuclease RuvC
MVLDTYIGIDPGQRGGVAVVGDRVSLAVPMPDPLAYLDLLRRFDPGRSIVMIERAQAMPGQGVVSMFGYGKHAGFLEGAALALGYRVELVRPQAWQAVMYEGVRGLDGKERSIAAVRRLYPEINLTPGRLRKPHDGIADAVLLAAYARNLRSSGREIRRQSVAD